MQQVRTDLIEIVAKLTAVIAMLEPAPPVDPKRPRLLCWGAKVNKDFRESVFWIEEQLGLNADNLMACMAFETGVTFSPSVKNSASSATGLIQFMEYTVDWMVKQYPALGRMATNTKELASMGAVKQLSWVYYYFKSYADRGLKLSEWDLADTYMAILLPNMIGKPLDAHMAWGQDAHKVNRGLDTNRDGVVTKGEAAKKVQQMLELGRMKENLA